MGSFRLENAKGNVWSGKLTDFNANVANNFYSYGFPSGYEALTQGGGGKAAKVVFQSEDFFTNVVDADQGRDFSNLAPNDFGFVERFFSDTSGLPEGSYSASELREMGIKGLAVSALMGWMPHPDGTCQRL